LIVPTHKYSGIDSGFNFVLTALSILSYAPVFY